MKKISYKVPAENSEYTKQYAIDVGDISGHRIRIFEIHRTFPNLEASPMYEGLRLNEIWTRGYADYVNVDGRHWGYEIGLLENGNKIFSRYDGTSQSTVNPDGTNKNKITGTSVLTGGTGKFRGIRSTFIYNGIFDPEGNLNEVQVEGEYWMEE
jgi:hypothetical protein